MNRWMRMDENDDGTTTLTVCLEEGEETIMVMPFDFDDIAMMIADGEGTVDIRDATAGCVIIPNTID
jgi:hypothetical protein